MIDSLNYFLFLNYTGSVNACSCSHGTSVCKLKCLGELAAQHRFPHATEKPDKPIVFELPSEVLQNIVEEFTRNFPLPFENFR